jgi:hypothetical protein
MRSTRRVLRKLIPLLFAGVVCTALILFSVALIITEMSGSAEAVKEVERSVESLFPRDPVTNRVTLALSMVPLEAKDAPLVAAMIENHVDARAHQEGLREAITVFEMIVEGDITRFMALYRSDHLPDLIGPIRSLRPHFVSIMRFYHPLILHAGGSQFAYDELNHNANLLHHDAIRYDGETYERDASIEPPHNLFLRKAPLLSVLEKQNPSPVSLPLFETSRNEPPNGGPARKISLHFGSDEHNVTFSYKPFFGLYIRSIFGSRQQAQPKTIVALETLVDGFNQKGYIPWTQTFGSGKMLIFRDGEVFEGTWQREKNGPLQFLDLDGNVLPVASGQVWITMLPMLSMVSWE